MKALVVGLLAGVVGCGAIPLEQAYSLDHRHRVELKVGIGGVQVQRDGQTIARHDIVDPDSLRLSAHGDHLAYATRQEDAWSVILDGQSDGSTWDAVLPGSLRLSPRGHLVYVARRGTALYVVEPRRLSGPYDGVSSLQVDAEAEHVAFIARRGAAAWAVLDGRARGPYASIAELALSPQRGHLAAIVRQSEHWAVLHDAALSPHDSAAGLRWDPTGQHLVYVARDDERERVVVMPEGSTGPRFDRVEWRSVKLVQDAQGNHTVPLYVAELDGARVAVRGTEPGPSYDQIRNLASFGRRHSYIGRRGQHEQAVIDGQPAPWFDEVGDLTLTPQGDGYAYLARQGPSLRLLSRQRTLPLSWAMAGSVVLCPDGARVGLLGGLLPHALEVLFDGRRLRLFDMDEPEAARRTWGEKGIRHWVEAELAPLCAG